MYADEREREVAEFLAAQGLEQADLTYAHRQLYADLEKRREDRAYRHGGESADVLITYRKEKREIEEKIAVDNEALRFQQQEELDKFLRQDDEKLVEIKLEKDKETAAEKSEVDKKEQLEIDPLQSYKDLTTDLKNAREKFFKEHFDEMLNIAQHPETPQEQIDYFIDRDKHYLSVMAHDHYKQLMDHPDNPHWKNAMDKMKQEIADEKARAEKLRLEREEVLRKEREAEIARKKHMFSLLREQLTQKNDQSRGIDR